MSDQELINCYLEGDEKAFETLLNRHKTKIYTSIYLFVKDSEQAEDIFQEVFIKIIDTIRRGKYNHEGKFLQWAMRISYNMCRSIQKVQAENQCFPFGWIWHIWRNTCKRFQYGAEHHSDANQW